MSTRRTRSKRWWRRDAEIDAASTEPFNLWDPEGRADPGWEVADPDGITRELEVETVAEYKRLEELRRLRDESEH